VCKIGLTIGWGRNEFYLLSPYIIFSYTYLSLCSYLRGMRNLTPSPSLTDLGIPTSSLLWIILLIKKEVFFYLGRNVAIHYPSKRWRQSMTTVIEKRETKIEKWELSLRLWLCEENKENFEKWVSYERLRLWLWVKWFRVWVSIYIKWVINWFYTIRTGLDLGLGGYLYLRYLSTTHVLKLEKTQTHTQI